MYLEFFGMRELPFTLTPNTDFFLDLDGHHRALEVIQLALESGEGFIKIIGEVGTGKTLLCRRLLNTISDNFVTAYVPNPFLTPDGLLLALAEELGLDVDHEKGRHHVLGEINRKLMEIRQSGKQVVFLLDEAQAMPEESIEVLRLLTNLETESKKLLQVVLFGQPELNDLLSRDSLRQLRQRITFSYTLRQLCRRNSQRNRVSPSRYRLADSWRTQPGSYRPLAPFLYAQSFGNVFDPVPDLFAGAAGQVALAAYIGRSDAVCLPGFQCLQFLHAQRRGQFGLEQ
jgi:MSHA biogenesis protein MshM